MKESTLIPLPCPFCGTTPGTDNDYFESNQGTKWGYLVCGCSAKGPEVRTSYQKVSKWKNDAIEAWNKRNPL
jgi:hypothetical protein